MAFWRKKPRFYLLDNKYRVIEAFTYGGKGYFMFDNQFETPTGRMLAAVAVYEEMRMNCDKDYLLKHTAAMEKLLSDPKKINIMAIAQINIHLRERLELMPMPDFIFKLASVIFFDDSESPYSYDFPYNEKKMAIWKKDPGMLDFFLQSPLPELIPSLKFPDKNSSTYLEIAKQIDQIHQDNLTEVLLEKE